MKQDQIEVTLKLPAPFYRVLKAAARANKMSVHGYIMRNLVEGLDCDLAQTEGLSERLGIEKQEGQATFQEQLRKMVGIRKTAMWSPF
jgi:hypothetical protein